MISQTQRFLDYGLAHPEEAVEIPAIPAGSGGFARSYADYFWHRVLGDY